MTKNGLCFLPNQRRRRAIKLTVLIFALLGALTALSECNGGSG